MLVDGGFALVSSNVLTIIADQVVSPTHSKREKIEQHIEKIRKDLAAGVYELDLRQHNKIKASLLEKLLV
jgi:F0F1-type ATP synthase epsilon subunit